MFAVAADAADIGVSTDVADVVGEWNLQWLLLCSFVFLILLQKLKWKMLMMMMVKYLMMMMMMKLQVWVQ